MLLAIFNCGVLFGIVWVFERKRIDMVNFSPADLLVLPCVVLLVPALIGIFVPLPPWLSIFTMLVFVGVTFWVCWRRLPTTRTRAVAYSIALLGANIALEIAITGGRAV